MHKLKYRFATFSLRETLGNRLRACHKVTQNNVFRTTFKRLQIITAYAVFYLFTIVLCNARSFRFERNSRRLHEENFSTVAVCWPWRWMSSLGYSASSEASLNPSRQHNFRSNKIPSDALWVVSAVPARLNPATTGKSQYSRGFWDDCMIKHNWMASLTALIIFNRPTD